MFFFFSFFSGGGDHSPLEQWGSQTLQHTSRNTAESSSCHVCFEYSFCGHRVCLESLNLSKTFFFLLLSPALQQPAREREHAPKTGYQPWLHPTRWRLGLGRRLRLLHFHRILLCLPQVPHHLLQGDPGVFFCFLQPDRLGLLSNARVNVCWRSVAKRVSATKMLRERMHPDE